MRVDILAIGSRGDVQPYVALGLGLRMAGYRVRIVTLGGFEDIVRDRGLDHLTIGDSPRTIAGTAVGQEWVQQRASAIGFLRGFVRVADSLIEKGVASYWAACQDVEALIVSPMGLLVGEHIAERLRVPLIRAQLAPPIVPTRYDWDGRKNLGTFVGGALNVSIDTAFNFLIWSKLRRSTNGARTKVLQLPSLSPTALFHAKSRKSLLLGGYSPAVACHLPDWPDWISVTGYWFLDDMPGWAPPRELIDFLASGSRPVFIGFGSTPFPQPDATKQLIVRAVASSGHRGIIVAGGSGLATGLLSRDVLSVDSVPHDWLFPQVCAAVHHGGAGVTGAALRAGLPSVVVPVFADQPFWGSRVFQLGAGPRPIPAKSLTEDNLTEALKATATGQMRGRAAALGERIRKEDGVGSAVAIIYKHLGRGALKAMRHQNAS